jgi:predicted Zn-dependent protease
MTQASFHGLADHATSLLRGREIFTAFYSGEVSDFCRFNGAKLRQAGSVEQARVRVELIDAGRGASVTLGLTAQPGADRARLATAIEMLRAQIPALPEDPHLLYATEPRSSEQGSRNELPDGAETVARIATAAGALDFVGIYASGTIRRGFANSFGQRNWHETHSFNLDFSCYLREDKAVKKSYAGARFDDEAFERVLEQARAELESLERAPRTIAPGRYRVYLAPAALKEIMGLLAWDAFGARAERTRQTPFLKLADGDAQLSASVTLREHAAGGLAPNFNAAGFLRPDSLTLIDCGTWRERLVSPRSAREYGIEPNGANERESPESLDLAGGTLAAADALTALGDGLLVNNLWYLNYSDRNACRVTGMTRFACFVVERGAIAAPFNVMRFDDSVLGMLGPKLEALTTETQWMPSADSYGERSVESMRLPGALIDELVFTL